MRTARAEYVRAKLEKAQSGEWSTAVHTAEPLVEMQQIVDGPDSSELADALVMLADVYSNLDRLPEAQAALQRAVLITRKHRATDPVAHIRSLNALGATYILLSAPRDAEPVLVEALKLAEQQFGSESTEVGVTARLLRGAVARSRMPPKASAPI
ncbi:MAG: tetratricopeptide repeat protein [Acidobacteriota bacterium]